MDQYQLASELNSHRQKAVQETSLFYVTIRCLVLEDIEEIHAYKECIFHPNIIYPHFQEGNLGGQKEDLKVVLNINKKGPNSSIIGSVIFCYNDKIPIEWDL